MCVPIIYIWLARHIGRDMPLRRDFNTKAQKSFAVSKTLCNFAPHLVQVSIVSIIK